MSQDAFKALIQNIHKSKHRKWGSGHKSRPEHYVCLPDVEWARSQFRKQKGLSYWLGLPIDMNKIFEKWHPLGPSIDRIDNRFGHTSENCVIALRFENLGFGNCLPEQRQALIDYVCNYFNVTVPNLPVEVVELSESLW